VEASTTTAMAPQVYACFIAVHPEEQVPIL